MKAGFTLIEILIVLLITTMIGSLLFTVLNQANTGLRVTDRLIHESQRAIILRQQLEKDFSGAMVPVVAVLEDEAKQDEAKQGATKQDVQNQQTKKDDAKTQKKEAVKPLTKLFLGTNKDKELDTLTFITNNPLQVYWSEKTGRLKSRVARVVYRLVPSKDEKNVFALMRQEGDDLYYESYKPGDKQVREFVLIEGIRSLTVQYAYLVDGKEKNKKKEVKIEAAWNSDEKKNKDKRVEKQLPDWLIVTCVLWDVSRKATAVYEFKITKEATGAPPTAIVEEPQGSRLDVLARDIESKLQKARSQMTTSTAQAEAPAGAAE